MSEFTREDVGKVILRMTYYWPSYTRWNEYTDPNVVQAWSDLLSSRGYVLGDVAQGLDDLVMDLKRDRQWPPSLSEIAEAAYWHRRKRVDAAAFERQQAEREAAHADRIRRAAAMVGSPDTPDDQRAAAEKFLKAAEKFLKEHADEV